MNNWVLGEPGASDMTGKILDMVEHMDSDTIRRLASQIWLLYDDAVLRETGHLYNLGTGDPHWEGHL
jgi:hypothetical protein